MTPTLAEVRHLRTTRVVGFSALLAMAVAIGFGAQSLAAPTGVICALLAVGSLTWYSPLVAERVALVALFVTPFLAVMPELKPDQVNVAAYYGLAVVPIAVVICARARRIAFDSGAVLLAAVLVSSLVTLLADGGLTASYSYLVWPLTTLAVYLVVLNASENSHAWLMSLIVAFSFVEALLGVSQSLLHWPVFTLAAPALYETDRGLLGYVLPGVTRVVGNGSGTFQHFNGLGSLLALALPLSFGWLLETPRELRRLMPFAVLAAGLLTSYSRGGWIGGAVGCLFVFWISRPRGSRSSIPLLAAAVLSVVALLMPYIRAYYEATQNVSSRIATWRYAIDQWLQHPERIPFGSGFGSLQQTILVREAAAGGQTLSALHSSSLQILLELGLAGLFLSGWFVITTMRPHILARRHRWQSWALGGILAFLVSQTVDNALFGMTGTCVFALAACLRRADARPEARSDA